MNDIKQRAERAQKEIYDLWAKTKKDFGTAGMQALVRQYIETEFTRDIPSSPHIAGPKERELVEYMVTLAHEHPDAGESMRRLGKLVTLLNQTKAELTAEPALGDIEIPLRLILDDAVRWDVKESDGAHWEYPESELQAILDALVPKAAGYMKRLFSELKAATPQPEAWTPCAERLPEPSPTAVLLAIFGQVKYGYRYEYRVRDAKEWAWKVGEIIYMGESRKAVTHWRPLPASPPSPEGWE